MFQLAVAGDYHINMEWQLLAARRTSDNNFAPFYTPPPVFPGILNNKTGGGAG